MFFYDFLNVFNFNTIDVGLISEMGKSFRKNVAESFAFFEFRS